MKHLKKRSAVKSERGRKTLRGKIQGKGSTSVRIKGEGGQDTEEKAICETRKKGGACLDKTRDTSQRVKKNGGTATY